VIVVIVTRLAPLLLWPPPLRRRQRVITGDCTSRNHRTSNYCRPRLRFSTAMNKASTRA